LKNLSDYHFDKGIDLHIHSTASDGTMPASKIVIMASGLHLKAIAITDHDTLEGSKEAVASMNSPFLRILTGVEISAKTPDSIQFSGTLHILGYNIQLDNSDLNKALSALQDARASRNPKIIKQLNNLGLEISMEDVKSKAENGLIGRPHIAEVLRKKGYVASLEEAFDRYLGKDRPGYVEKYKMPCDRTIELIKKADGIPVLAHPCFLNLNEKELEEFVCLLKSMGLEGIEAFYPEHSNEQTAFYCKLAKQFGLKKSGGTDYHGFFKPLIKIGEGEGDFSVPFKIYEELMLGVNFNGSGGS